MSSEILEANCSLEALATIDAGILPELLLLLKDSGSTLVSKSAMKRLQATVPHNMAAMKCLCQIYINKLQKTGSEELKQKYRLKLLRCLLTYFEHNRPENIGLKEWKFLKILSSTVKLKHNIPLRELVDCEELWRKVFLGTNLKKLYFARQLDKLEIAIDIAELGSLHDAQFCSKLRETLM